MVMEDSKEKELLDKCLIKIIELEADHAKYKLALEHVKQHMTVVTSQYRQSPVWVIANKALEDK